MIDQQILDFSNKYEGLALWKIEPPLDLNLNQEEQVRLLSERTRLHRCNDSFASMYGYNSAVELQGALLMDLWGDNTDQITNIVELYVEESFEVSNLEVNQIDKNGESHWFLNFSQPKIDGNYLNGVWTTQIDITQRKKLALQLSKSQSDIEAIMQHTNDIILSINRDYQLITINHAGKLAFQGVFEVDPKPGTNILEIIPDFLVPIWKERYDRALGGERFSIEDHYKDEKGELFYDLSFYPITVNGKVSSASVISRDITDRKKNELQLKESEERYKALAEEKEKLLSSLKEYTFHTSHILRSPLTNIMSIADLVMSSGQDNSELQESLQMMLEESKRLDAIVREMNNKLTIS